MSPLFYQGLGAYAAVGTVIGLWLGVDVTRTVRGRTVVTNHGLGWASFLAGLIWPLWVIGFTGFLLVENYRRWKRASPEPIILGPDPPGRTPIGWPVYESGASDYSFGCQAGAPEGNGFITIVRHDSDIFFRAGYRDHASAMFKLTSEQANAIAQGLMLSLPKPSPGPPPVLAPVEPERRSAWTRLLDDEDT